MGDVDIDGDDVDAVNSQTATQLRQPSTTSSILLDHRDDPNDDPTAIDLSDLFPPQPAPSSPSLSAVADGVSAVVAALDPLVDTAAGAAPSSAPPKRPPSSYFLFCAEQRLSARAEAGVGGVAAVAKVLGQRWKALTAEERLPYETTAKQTKADYLLALQRQQRTAPTLRPLSSPAEVFLPPGAVRRLLHLDPSIKRTSKEAVLLLSRTTELFLALLLSQCVKVAQGRKRRRLMMEDVLAVSEGVTGMDFLRSEMRHMKRDIDQQREVERKQREDAREAEQHDAHTAEAEAGEVDGEAVEGDAENQPAKGEEGESKGEAVQGAKAVGSSGRGKKGKMGAIDTRQYASLTSMFSRMAEGPEKRKDRQRRRVEEEDENKDDGVEEIVRELEGEEGEEEGEQQQLQLHAAAEVEEVEEEEEDNEAAEGDLFVDVDEGGRERAAPKRRRPLLAAANDIDDDDDAASDV